MEINAEPEYREWYNGCIQEISKLKNRSRLLSGIRLLVFLGFIAATIAGFTYSTGFLWAAALLLAGFIYLLIYHEKVQNEIRYNETYCSVLNDELSAINYKYSFEPGEKYTDASHPFTYDLDIFGKDSLFNSLNRTATNHGSDRLADMFINPLKNANDIGQRQKAIGELSGKHAWLLKFRTYGILGKTSESSEGELLSWMDSKPLFRSVGFTLLLWIIPVLSVFMSVLVGIGYVSSPVFLLYLSVPLTISGVFATRITRRHMQVSRKASMLDNYANRMKMMERDEFQSVMLQNIQHSISHHNKPASYSIRKLSRIISSMDARLNWLMWIILNFLLLWDIRQMRRLENWQRDHHDELHKWFDSLAETEALGSLSGFYILNPAFIFPEVTSNPLSVSAVEAGHPLIPSNRRINNTIRINGKGSFNIITGANMAGKSTYLRTTGVNLVLAMAGAPVCAEKFVFYPAVLYTSLHTVDSLSSNKSYFFAELERLKLIIDTLNKGENIYVFLDEILKGTNSYDKQLGSKALLKQLVTLGTAGMIATHDLDLGQLEQSFPDNISNFSFEAVIKETELYFDYKLNPGIARNMNATFLMKKMGITL
jgi:DNA mismatch repair ATPase MutS